MIISQTPTEIEVTVDQTRSAYVALECTDAVLFSFIGLDSGDGYRPFHPFLFKMDGVESVLPLSVVAGSHVIELIGEWFEGTGLLVVGYGLQAVTRLDIGSTSAEAAAQVAAMPKILEGYGPPPDSLLTGINGSQYLDKLNGFWHKEVLGAWQQQP